MNPQVGAFLTQSSSLSSLTQAYKVPRLYIDCRQLLNKKLIEKTGQSKPQLTSKQKEQFKKKFYLDELVKNSKNIPSPNKYLEKYSTHKRYKSQNTFLTKPNQNQLNLGKRPTWIEDIEKYQRKHKHPSVTKYNLLTKTDFNVPIKNLKIQNLLKNNTKYSNFDDSIYVGSQIPGPGAHNPRKMVPKLKVNMGNVSSMKKKHEEDEKRTLKRLNQSKTSSFTYSPVLDKTFESIRKQPKKESSLMKVISIDKRKGLNSSVLSPGPGAHNLLNRWASQTFKRQNILGNYNLFAKTTRSFPSLKVYH